MQMRLGKRDWRNAKWVLSQKETYLGLFRALKVLDEPFSLIREELFSCSLRRNRISLHTPIGRVYVHLNSAVDLSTVMGVFCREDYRIGSGAKVVIDVGANIGIASLYFLTRDKDTFVYAYEPVPQNVETFRQNIAPYAERCELVEVAVGPESGLVDFGLEPTGKFGGIKVPSVTNIRVPCVTINEVMERVVSKHGAIDCLKIDVEGSEREILSSMARQFWDRVGCVYAEDCNCVGFMPPNFRRTFRYNVERLARVSGIVADRKV